MACYHPNVMTGKVDPGTGQVVYTFDGPSGRFDPFQFPGIDDFVQTGKYQFLVPCGHCLGCRIDYSRTWANRMVLELKDNPSAIFLTLTYNNDHVPRSDNGNMTLCVRDCQLFFKRLRKAHPYQKIRYYLAGEYGPKNLRPHYHAIVYGLSISDFLDVRIKGKNKLGQLYYTSEYLESIWGNGYILFSPVTYRTCAYVARYTLKKHYGDSGYYVKRGVLPEFSLCSRKPGIGMLHAYELVLSGSSRISVNGNDGVYSFGLPKAFYRSVLHMDLDQSDLDEISDALYNRAKLSETRTLSAALYSRKTFDEYLRSEEAKFASKISVLPERGDFGEEESQD